MGLGGGGKELSCITYFYLFLQIGYQSGLVEGRPTTGLLHMGSEVSCISESFLKAPLNHFEGKPLDYILNVPGVNGALLPYFGFVKADIKFKETVVEHFFQYFS